MCYSTYMPNKCFKYRIYPTKAQETLLNNCLEECRWLYNHTLATRKDAWEQEQRSVNWYQTKAAIPTLKMERPSLSNVHSQVLQDVTMRVDLAYKAFFRRIKAGEDPGYPRFKGEGRYNSITYPQYGNGAKLEENRLVISKIGAVRVKLPRELCGKPKTVCIRRSSTGKWFATFSCEYVPSPLPEEPKRIGIDVGTQTFATLSTGEKIDNPRFFRKEQKALAKAQRRLNKSKGQPKFRKVVSRVHERIANKRSDFAHKLSRQLVNTYGVIVFEKLDIKGMMSQHTVVFGNKLNKSIADVAWHQFAQFVSYKAADAGRIFLQVDPRNTSKRCSRCSSIVPKELGDRIHDCPHCGLVLDRDHNAAINILALGLQSIGLSVEAHAF